MEYERPVGCYPSYSDELATDALRVILHFDFHSKGLALHVQKIRCPNQRHILITWALDGAIDPAVFDRRLKSLVELFQRNPQRQPQAIDPTDPGWMKSMEDVLRPIIFWQDDMFITMFNNLLNQWYDRGNGSFHFDFDYSYGYGDFGDNESPYSILLQRLHTAGFESTAATSPWPVDQVNKLSWDIAHICKGEKCKTPKERRIAMVDVFRQIGMLYAVDEAALFHWAWGIEEFMIIGRIWDSLCMIKHWQYRLRQRGVLYPVVCAKEADWQPAGLDVKYQNRQGLAMSFTPRKGEPHERLTCDLQTRWGTNFGLERPREFRVRTAPGGEDFWCQVPLKEEPPKTSSQDNAEKMALQQEVAEKPQPETEKFDDETKLRVMMEKLEIVGKGLFGLVPQCRKVKSEIKGMLDRKASGDTSQRSKDSWAVIDAQKLLDGVEERRVDREQEWLAARLASIEDRKLKEAQGSEDMDVDEI